MDDAQRGYISDIEHHGLLLGRYGFQRLADAIRLADRPALLTCLAAQFVGQDTTAPNAVRAASDVVEAVRYEYSGGPTRSLTRDQFCDRLFGFRGRFAVTPKVGFSLMALSPDVRGQLDGPWHATAQLRIWSEASPGQPAEAILDLQIQLPRPAESTFALGGWLRACTVRQTMIARAPHYLLRETAQEHGIDRSRFHDNWLHGLKATTTGGVYVCDYNRDGCLDLLVVDLNVIALYQGRPDGRFTDVTLEAGLPPRLLSPFGPNLVAVFADLDGDGWDDLVLDRRVFRNENGQRFVDVSRQSNLRLNGDLSGTAVADYNRDGKLDLYVCRLTPSRASSWLDGKGDGRGGNALLRNRGDWQFEDVAVEAGVRGGDRSTFTAAWLDADNDGWPDLYIINEFGNGALFRNRTDGTFQKYALTKGPGDFGSMGLAAADVDNDGNIDLYVANMYSKAGNCVMNNVAPGTHPDNVMSTMRTFVAGSQLHRNRGGLQFEPVGQKWQVAAVGWAYGPAFVDLDNDGWPDIYATAGFVSQDRKKPDG